MDPPTAVGQIPPLSRSSRETRVSLMGVQDIHRTLKQQANIRPTAPLTARITDKRPHHHQKHRAKRTTGIPRNHNTAGTRTAWTQAVDPRDSSPAKRMWPDTTSRRMISNSSTARGATATAKVSMASRGSTTRLSIYEGTMEKNFPLQNGQPVMQTVRTREMPKWP